MRRSWPRYASRMVGFALLTACGDDASTQQTSPVAAGTEPDGAIIYSYSAPETGVGGGTGPGLLDAGSLPSGNSVPNAPSGDASLNDTDMDWQSYDDSDDSPLPPFGVVAPDPSLGLTCHDLQVNGGLVTPEVVTTPWDPPAGGTLMTGLYHLKAEQRFIPSGASEDDAQSCGEFWGVYRESLRITDSEWQRVVRFEDLTRGRQTFTYHVDGNTIARTQTCPAPMAGEMPYSPVTPYTVSGNDLLVFDSVTDPALPGNPTVCEYLYKYERQP